VRKPKYTSKRFVAFVATCRWQANKQWAYGGLVDDHPERVEQAYQLKENPKDFVRWLGEKYDLIDYNEWKRGF
jgi:hypothetical protein